MNKLCLIGSSLPTLCKRMGRDVRVSMALPQTAQPSSILPA